MFKDADAVRRFINKTERNIGEHPDESKIEIEIDDAVNMLFFMSRALRVVDSCVRIAEGDYR